MMLLEFPLWECCGLGNPLAGSATSARGSEPNDNDNSYPAMRQQTQSNKTPELKALSDSNETARPHPTRSYWVALGLIGIIAIIGTVVYASGVTNGGPSGSNPGAPDIIATSSTAVPVGPTRPRSVDWRNHAYHATCDGLAESGFAESSGFTVDLHGGSATATNPIDENQKYFYKLRTAVAGDVTGDGQPETIVLLSCEPIGANYYNEEAQVFTSGDNLLGELPSPQTLQGNAVVAPEYVPTELRVANGNIVAGMLFYRVGDSHAEGATIPRTLIWRWTGSLFEQVQ